MRKIATLAACMLIIAACAQKKQETAAKNEQPTTITWIEDKPDRAFSRFRRKI